MRKTVIPLLVFSLLMFSSCDWPWSGSDDQILPIQVNSLEDTWPPPEGIITLRAALRDIGSGGTITFDPTLNGGTIDLVEIDSDHSVLRGEVFLDGWDYQGYLERDYGRSALYARKNVTIDASTLPAGITLAWAGSDQTPARVLAVYGDLTMRNVTVTGGWSQSEPITTSQEHTLARGAGLAVWGVATLEDCTIHGNRAFGDEIGSRDRGAFGGGIYADRVVLRDCIISGNSVTGYGAAGGGVYSIGGSNGLGAHNLLDSGDGDHHIGVLNEFKDRSNPEAIERRFESLDLVDFCDAHMCAVRACVVCNAATAPSVADDEEPLPLRHEVRQSTERLVHRLSNGMLVLSYGLERGVVDHDDGETDPVLELTNEPHVAGGGLLGTSEDVDARVNNEAREVGAVVEQNVWISIDDRGHNVHMRVQIIRPRSARIDPTIDEIFDNVVLRGSVVPAGYDLGPATLKCLKKNRRLRFEMQ